MRPFRAASAASPPSSGPAAPGPTALSSSSPTHRWEHVAALARTDASGFVLCGRWYLRPCRVRLIKRAEYASHPGGENSAYEVYLSMVDTDRDDGWVARLTLDLESGRELTKHLRTRQATAAVD